jgi:hypothetical protein
MKGFPKNFSGKRDVHQINTLLDIPAKFGDAYKFESELNYIPKGITRDPDDFLIRLLAAKGGAEIFERHFPFLPKQKKNQIPNLVRQAVHPVNRQ